jgi:hypothetical protein
MTVVKVEGHDVPLRVLVSLALLTFSTLVHAAPREANGYTRYELLAPGSAKFRIVYDITAVTPGSTAFFNPIRKGSVATDESVTDLATGAPLKFEVVSGEAAKAAGWSDAEASMDYIEVHLARPVPADGGEGRIRIEKTYADPKSYRVEGDQIVFDRSLGIKKNAVVLPVGYGLVSCNYPAQVLREPDGRLKISFLNTTPAEAPLIIRAKKVYVSAGPSSVQAKLEDRAVQTRDIVYFLQPPETHAFDLYHDYTETKEGVADYVNVVRTGSAASHPSARNLDTGDAIPARILKGAAITAAGIHEDGLTVTPDAEVVVFPFKPLAHGQSIRLRMSETYIDPERYKLVGDELVFDRTFGRASNAVVLPAGWSLTNSTAPATVSTLEDGRTRLDFLNPRTDEVEVLITARKRSGE